METASNMAHTTTQKLGMVTAQPQFKNFLKKTNLAQDVRQEVEEELENIPDFLDSENDGINLSSLNDTFDDNVDEDFFTIQDLSFTEEPSGT